MLVRGVAIGALPWLSTKYAPMAAAVTIVLLLRSRWNPRAAAALLAPIALAYRRLVRVLFLDLGHGIAVGAIRIVGDHDAGSPGARRARACSSIRNTGSLPTRPSWCSRSWERRRCFAPVVRQRAGRWN